MIVADNSPYVAVIVASPAFKPLILPSAWNPATLLSEFLNTIASVSVILVSNSNIALSPVPIVISFSLKLSV